LFIPKTCPINTCLAKKKKKLILAHKNRFCPI
jgi:hypothetical protein